MWFHPNVLDNGLVYLRANSTAYHVIDGFDPEVDTRATVIARSLGTVAYTNADIAAPADHTPDGRKLIGVSKPVTMTSALAAGAGDIKVAIISSAIVLAVVDETTERAIASGEIITFPQIILILRNVQ